jgi:hypothetical protein
MAPVYTVQPLAPERVDQAYPLVHAIEPSLAPSAWRRLCAATGGATPNADRAVLIVTAATDRFYGLCTVEVQRQPDKPCVLCLTRLIIGHPLDQQRIGEALLRALADHARQAGCNGLRIVMAGSDQPGLSALDHARATLDVGLPIEVV